LYLLLVAAAWLWYLNGCGLAVVPWLWLGCFGSFAWAAVVPWLQLGCYSCGALDCGALLVAVGLTAVVPWLLWCLDCFSCCGALAAMTVVPWLRLLWCLGCYGCGALALA